jgi:alanine racemase
MDLNYLKAFINQTALTNNCNLLKNLATGKKICVAIKANAYGHTIKIVLPVMHKVGIDFLAVAAVEEAVELRQEGWNKPILILGSEFSIYSESEQYEIADWIVKNDVRLTITRKKDADVLAAAAERHNKPCWIHLAFDSGMSRMGRNEEDLLELISDLQNLPRIEMEGLYTHFATADEADKTFAMEQLAHFAAMLEKVKNKGINIPIIHAANSGATVDLPEAHFNMVRPGISVYGYHAGSEMHNKPDLQPALKLVSYLTVVKKIPAGSFVGYGRTFQTTRDSVIGLVPIGYADGFPRELSNRGKMIVANVVVPIIGRISMDQTIIDLTELASRGITPQPGDEVIIYDNNRESPNSVENTANLLGTISYCLTTALGRRVKRIAVQ